MPYLLDLLTLLMEAGATFLNALNQAVDEFRGHPVAEEFGRVLADMNLGKTRMEAFQAMRDRLADDEITSIIGTIIQGEHLGTPLARIFRSQADVLRVKRSQRAESIAGEAGVNMLMPAVLVMAATVLIILGPFLLNFMKIWSMDDSKRSWRRMAVRTQCPRCKQPLSVPNKLAGSYANCPRCQGRFWISKDAPVDPSVSDSVNLSGSTLTLDAGSCRRTGAAVAVRRHSRSRPRGTCFAVELAPIAPSTPLRTQVAPVGRRLAARAAAAAAGPQGRAAGLGGRCAVEPENRRRRPVAQLATPGRRQKGQGPRQVAIDTAG